MWIKNQALDGNYVRLEPLMMLHVSALQEAVKDGEYWRLWYASVPKPDDISDYVAKAIEQAKQGEVAYAVIDKRINTVVGTTRYYNVDGPNKRAAIGYTWYANSVRRSPINTESKLLLLSNLFESCDAVAVEFNTHFFNQTSRAAIERLGAKLDGILRAHKIMKDGSLRDTAVYSIIASEWPTVRNNLEYKLYEHA
ncbi:GNAT family N-acetyltransferase [Pseudoalteromonas aurantia]|uniref:GNAT family N-acetyltransferase n=1 Tax=Pseudoalteromonas aurantia TaxID=43654 RepID=A0ABY2VW74_9GAMM|nr:GNAT family protein [Pseudoalteromonas aurantia]TMO54901.1 GNAT family N-acetyltransferase [Pseudoalteromonas aurantia]TMO73502.1 GNAT family N-acetyltransferase [Pseudoalteromonas aurantia]